MRFLPQKLKSLQKISTRKLVNGTIAVKPFKRDQTMETSFY